MAWNSFDSSAEYYWYVAVQSTVTLLHINNDIKFNFDNPYLLLRLLYHLKTAICKNRNGESGNRMRGMREMGVGMQGIRVGMQGIWVGMRGIRVGMWGMWEMGWEYGESGWECGESGWICGESGWECRESGWQCGESESL